ncbi:hypothetical protein NCCP2716_31080 [Sporosarcina sp. NCCP-2716]|uniref:hypothetical protein n=1 Tax=Sporosarcina sp. NCCP-2716 TaxID=2943679 RepID=UPI00204245EE|nr:hypothetical protein [Sporosarcina sp. NCCP-2716]GKV70610.1 hypothetical protein NCCP2716_31080 [Sporosarcina sp. NCCP-2716]
MNRTYLTHEFLMTAASKRTIPFLLFIGIVLLSYCFLLVPNRETAETLHPDETRSYLTKLEVEQEQRLESGHTGIVLMTGEPVFARNAYYHGLFSALLNSYEDRNFLRYLHLRASYLESDPSVYTRDDTLFSNSPFPVKDREHLYHQTMLRYGDFLSNDREITEGLLFEKTGIQSLQVFLQTYGFFFILFCAVYFSSDLLSRDRSHRTVLQGLPISWYRQLNLKSLSAFLYTLLVIIGVLAAGSLLLAVQYGIGPFNLDVPIMTAQQTFSIDEYGVMSILKFLGLSLLAVPLLVFLVIRLNVILGLLFKNEWIVLLLGTLAVFSERLYATRSTRELAGIDVSYFPQTYFDFGKIVTGEKNFLLNTETITLGKGFAVLLITLLILETILFVLSRVITKRRLYQSR